MKDTFILRKENRISIDRMSDQDAGALFKAILAHADGEEVNLDDSAFAVQLLFPLIASQIDRTEEAYRETCEKRAEAGRLGGRPKKPNGFIENQKNQKVFEESKKSKSKHIEPEPEYEPDSDDKRKAPTEPKEKQTRFSPPTVTDVAEYASEKGIRIDAERFVDFYASKGWKVGSSPMKDWRAAARNWAARDKREKPPNTPPPSGGVYSPLDGVDYSKLLKVGG